MIWALIFCVIAMLILAGITVYCVNELGRINEGSVNGHDRCHEQAQSLLQMSTVRAEAQALRRAANLWDSIEQEQAKRILAREKYVEGGPSVPAIWLRQQATELDGKNHD
jgi:hypothetical protein